MVTIYTLDGCRFCNEVKQLMYEEEILYKEVCSSKYSSICDKLEESLRTEYYPIVKIDNSSKPIFIISNSSEYPRTLYPHTFYYDTIHHLLHLIKQHI